jgi:hypothetical protein
MSVHAGLTGTDIHTPITWTYANAAARTSATGFASTDLTKFALQSDTNQVWMLTATTPTWTPIITVVGNPTTADATADVMIAASAAAQTPLKVQGNPTQTANLFEAQTSDGTPQFYVNSSGTAVGTFSGNGQSLTNISPSHLSAGTLPRTVAAISCGGYTVANLPAGPLTGLYAYVTDGASSIAWGNTVTGGGSTKYLVWYNGSAWTVAGK